MGSSKEKESSQARQTKKENYLDQALIARTKVTAVAPYGGSGRASIALSQNIASPKQPNLFDGEEIAVRDMRIASEKSIYRSNRDGKPVWLSNKDTKLVMLLSSTINVNDEDVKEWINWIDEVDVKGFTDELKETMPNPIARFYKLKDLAQAMYGRSKKEQIGEVYDALQRLQNIEQKATLGKSEMLFEGTLLQKDIGFKDNAKDESKPDRSEQRIIFTAIFLWNIDKRFGLLPPKLFEVWRRKGNGTETELFSTLLTTLLAIYYYHQVAAKEARRAVKREFEERQVSEEDKDRILNERVTEALTFHLTYKLLKSKMTTDYDSKKQYRAKFKSDLSKAIEVLKEIGLITKVYISKSQEGEDMANFIINENYGKQALLAPVVDE
ncbi:MAG: hypothetical protein HUJ90_00815 [Bacteroidales bacterium]|nr:hypothetical protein [Bacteroidales bacterium]